MEHLFAFYKKVCYNGINQGKNEVSYGQSRKIDYGYGLYP